MLQHVHLLGPRLMHYHSMMQGWRQQGHVLLSGSTSKTHHTAVPSTAGAGTPHSPSLLPQQGMLSPCNLCWATPACLSCSKLGIWVVLHAGCPRLPQLQGTLWLL